MRLKPVDIITLGYLAVVSGLLCVFRARVPAWPAYLSAAAVYALAIVLLSRAPAEEDARSVWAFIRRLYPLLLMPLLFESIPGYVTLLWGRFLDPEMIAFETAVFGGKPNLALEAIVARPVSEFFFACYFSYYFYIVLPPLVLFFKKRYDDLDRYVFSLMLAFYVCYIGFLIVPVLGPIFALRAEFAIPKLQGYVFAPLQTWIMGRSDPIGTCFPSSHVAVAWTALLAMRAVFGKKVFWRIAPFTAGLTVAVVYNRYHYATDAFAGLVTAAGVAWIVRRVWTRRPAAATLNH